MSKDLRGFFKNHPSDNPVLINRIANEIMRGGIIDMDNLIDLMEKDPIKIMEIRNIGPRSFDIISDICSIYKIQIKK